MSEKKHKISKAILYTYSCYLIIITLFFLYELTIIKNPFNDPISPYILWGVLVIISWGLGFRYFVSMRR